MIKDRSRTSGEGHAYESSRDDKERVNTTPRPRLTSGAFSDKRKPRLGRMLISSSAQEKRQATHIVRGLVGFGPRRIMTMGAFEYRRRRANGRHYAFGAPSAGTGITQATANILAAAAELQRFSLVVWIVRVLLSLQGRW